MTIKTKNQLIQLIKQSKVDEVFQSTGKPSEQTKVKKLITGNQTIIIIKLGNNGGIK